MRGQFALRAKVIEAGAEAGAVEDLPEPVHDRAAGNRIIFRGDPVGQIETGEALFFGARAQSREERGRRGQDDGTGLIEEVTARQDADRERFGGLGDH